jgi:translation initiation factor IF-3
VAVPRRFDRRPPERDLTRINERIRVPEVRVIDDEGNQVGVMKTPDAVKFAQERDLDLVEVAPEAKPPVCRVLDYSKYKYEQAQKVKQARKHQQQITIREIKFRPKIAQHDYDTKKHHVERFLRHKDKVKITIMFRGREVTHPERGVMILDRLAEELAALGVVEQRPTQDGRNMTMMLGPSKAVLAGKADGVESPDGVVATLDGSLSPGAVTGAPDGSLSPGAVTGAPDSSPSPDGVVETSVDAATDSSPSPDGVVETSVDAATDGSPSPDAVVEEGADDGSDGAVDASLDVASDGVPAVAAESQNGASDGAVS